MEGEAKGGDKFSAAAASEKLKNEESVQNDWTARLCCSEAEVKRVFTKLAQEKKKLSKAKATEEIAKYAVVEVESNEQPSKPRRGRPRKTQNVEEKPENIDDLFTSLESSGVPDSQLETF